MKDFLSKGYKRLQVTCDWRVCWVDLDLEKRHIKMDSKREENYVLLECVSSCKTAASKKKKKTPPCQDLPLSLLLERFSSEKPMRSFQCGLFWGFATITWHLRTGHTHHKHTRNLSGVRVWMFTLFLDSLRVVLWYRITALYHGNPWTCVDQINRNPPPFAPAETQVGLDGVGRVRDHKGIDSQRMWS